jgi:hypothetical protein
MATDQAVVGEPIACARCDVTLGKEPGACRRAKGTDICLECALLCDPPTAIAQADGADDEELSIAGGYTE